MIKNKSNKPFFDHLEELRSRIIKCFITVIFFSILGYIYSNSIISFLIKPVQELDVTFQVLKITSIFLVKIGLAIVCGILFSLPVILYQFLVFLLPAFENKVTTNKILRYVLLNLIFFILGLAFGYFILVPLSIEFFNSLSISMEYIELNYTLENYLFYMVWLMVISSFIFQLPFILLIFNKIGIINRNYLIDHRRSIILLFFIMGAFFTPPDPLSQIIVVIPMYILFEISIFFMSRNK
jgi:sec-independent protein translocase protein TatC